MVYGDDLVTFCAMIANSAGAENRLGAVKRGTSSKSHMIWQCDRPHLRRCSSDADEAERWPPPDGCQRCHWHEVLNAVLTEEDDYKVVRAG